MSLSASSFSASTRKAGSLESSGRHLRFSNRMSRVINSINDDVYPSRDYIENDYKEPDTRRSIRKGSPERAPNSYDDDDEYDYRRQNEPFRSKRGPSMRYGDRSDDSEVITDITNEYSRAKQSQPLPQPRNRSLREPIHVTSTYDRDEYDNDDLPIEKPRKKNLDIAPLPDSKIKIKPTKSKMPIHIDESNFRESNRTSLRDDFMNHVNKSKSRSIQENNQSNNRGSRRQSIESIESNVTGSEYGKKQAKDFESEDDTRSLDMGADEIEIYPDEDKESRKSVDLSAVKQNFDYPIFKSLIYNTLDFIQTPAPPGITVKCKLVMARGVFNEFTLYLEGYAGYDLPIMITRRRRAVPNIYYYIDAFYIERTINKTQNAIPFGRLCSNLKRKSFSLVGNRNNEKILSASTQNLNLSMSLDQQLNTPSQVVNQKKYLDLTFNTKLFGTSKPKEFIVDALINHSAEDSQNKGRDSSASRQRDTSENFRRVSKRVTLLNKKAEYDPMTKKYRLDFHGRAKKPSANNIQVIEESDTKKILFQLGKVKSKCYYMDFAYPLCAFQAFGIAVSCLSRN